MSIVVNGIFQSIKSSLNKVINYRSVDYNFGNNSMFEACVKLIKLMSFAARCVIHTHSDPLSLVSLTIILSHQHSYVLVLWIEICMVCIRHCSYKAFFLLHVLALSLNFSAVTVPPFSCSYLPVHTLHPLAITLLSCRHYTSRCLLHREL